MGQVETFKDFFCNELDSNGVIGGAFIFSKEGETVLKINHGVADIERGLYVDDDTLFHWASNTKTLTGIAIMQLRDRGCFSLGDRVIDFLPEIAVVRNPYGSIDEVTIRHLMNHSSGFRNPTYPYKTGHPSEPFEPREYSLVESKLPFTELLFRPGEQFGYSNLGIVFLGRIIELFSGDNYETYVEKNVFKPLGMDRSYFDCTPYHMIQHRSHSYFRENGALREGVFDADTGITTSNGGLNAPVRDMVKYLDFLVGNGPSDHSPLSRNSLEEMFSPSIRSDSDANGYRWMTTDVGLTFFIDDVDRDVFIGHGGDQNGFISYVEFNVKRRTFSIFVVNTTVITTDSSASEQEPDLIMRLRMETRKLHTSF